MVRAHLRPSYVLAASSSVVHVAAAATVFPLDASIEVKAALTILIVGSLIHTIYRHALLRSRNSILELEIHDQGRAAIRTRASDWQDARILCTSCVTAGLTVLNLRPEGRRIARHVLLVRDNVDAEDFRRIRVLLRWARPKAEKPGSEPEETGV